MYVIHFLDLANISTLPFFFFSETDQGVMAWRLRIRGEVDFSGSMLLTAERI